MGIEQIVAVVGTLVVLVCACVWAICRSLEELTSLRKQLKEADRRYQQIYDEYIRECASNPSRPRLTTCTQNQWVPGTTMSQEQWDAIQKPKA